MNKEGMMKVSLKDLFGKKEQQTTTGKDIPETVKDLGERVVAELKELCRRRNETNSSGGWYRAIPEATG